MFFSLGLLCLFASALRAQTVNPPTNLQLCIKSVNDTLSGVADTSIFPLAYPLLDSTGTPVAMTDSVNIIALFEVADTTNTSVVNIKVGITPGGDEVLESAIPFSVNDTNSLYIYKRTGSSVFFCLGNAPSGDYYYEVSLENGAGNQSVGVRPTQVRYINLQ